MLVLTLGSATAAGLALTAPEKALVDKISLDRWFVTRLSDENMTAIDKTRVSSPARDHLIIWERWDFTELQKDPKPIIVAWNNKGNPIWGSSQIYYDHSLQRIELDCSNIRHREVAPLIMYKETEQVDTIPSNDTWIDPLPETVGESHYRAACLYLMAPEPTVGSPDVPRTSQLNCPSGFDCVKKSGQLVGLCIKQ